jgi:molecular chaperone GrpE
MSEEIKDEEKEQEPQEAETEEESQVEDPAQGEEEGEGTKDESQKEEVDWKDKYLRLHADWENYRKRMDEQRADERVRATESLMKELLPLIDDMHHALDYAEKNGDGDLKEGFSAIETKFLSSLEKHGLQVIDPAGEPFDPIMHQAVSTVEDAEVFDETVKDVYQKGYKLGIKVLRPAMVTVSTGGEKRPAENEQEEESCEE